MALLSPLTRALGWGRIPHHAAPSSPPSTHIDDPNLHKKFPEGLLLSVPIWGFVVTLLLVMGSSVLSLVEVSRAQHDVIQLFERSERTTFLIGRVSKDLSQSFSTLRQALSSEPGARAQAAERARMEVPRIETSISADMNELRPLLSAEGRELWDTLDADLDQVLADLSETRTLIEQGDLVGADRVLERAVVNAAPVNNGLNALSVHNQQRVANNLSATERRLELVKLVELVLGVFLLGTVMAAWSFAIRTIREQRRQLSEYVVGIETARRDLDAFAGRVAHDLRNALGPLPLAAASLQRNPDKPELVQKAADRVQRASLRSTALLDALLSFSRAGKPSEEHAVASLGETLRMSAEGLRPLAERVGAELHVDVPAGLRLAIAPPLLDSVITNLLSNALKFLEGRSRREVHIKAHREGDMGVLVVTDTGPGIPPEAQGRLFKPFYRVPGTSVSGTGIGLATVHRIVHAHGGHIRVDSKFGEGARFEVRLPAV